MMSILADTPTTITIPNTRHKVKLGFLRDCTIDKVTQLLLEREAKDENAEDAEGLMRSVAKNPYLNLKIAVCYVLNDYWKIRLFFPLVWRWWAYVWRLNESQIASVLAEAQKKTAGQLNWYSTNMGFVKAIRADLKTLATQSPSPLTQKSESGQPS